MKNNDLPTKPGYLPDQIIQKIFEEDIYPDLFVGRGLPSLLGKPEVVLVGGQPGSGKNDTCKRARAEILERTGSDAIVLDMDALRKYHPRFTEFNKSNDKTSGYYTNYAANRWLEMAIKYGVQNRYNMVIEDTFKRPDGVAARVEMLCRDGYSVKAEVVSTPYAVSKLSTQIRYEKPKEGKRPGRQVPTEIHDSAFLACPETLQRLQDQKLVESITIRRRDGVPIYNNELVHGEWESADCAKTAYLIDRERKLDQQEAKYLKVDLTDLYRMLSNEERNPAPSDLAAAHAHTFLANELLLKSGQEPYQDKTTHGRMAERMTAQDVLNEMAAKAATSQKHGEVYASILQKLDEPYRAKQQTHGERMAEKAKDVGMHRRDLPSNEPER